MAATSNKTIDEKYQEAIQSLKRINNELFYDDLKNLLKTREQTIADINDEVYETIEKMQKLLSLFPAQMSNQLKEKIVEPQSEQFDQAMERFTESLTIMENKMASWHKQYQQYLVKTEMLVTYLKELQSGDQEFAVEQTDRILAKLTLVEEQVSGLVEKAFTEHANRVNVKYEAISDRLSTILQALQVVENSQKAEIEHWQQQNQQEQKRLQEKWDAKWRQRFDSFSKREARIKKWLIGLAVGQGLSIVLLVMSLVF